MPTAWPRLAPPVRGSGRRSPTERARAVELACRTAMQLLDGAPERAARMAHVDPVPPSTRALLRRLVAR